MKKINKEIKKIMDKKLKNKANYKAFERLTEK